MSVYIHGVRERAFVVNYLTWTVGAELKSSARALSVGNCRVNSLALNPSFLNLPQGKNN